MQRRTFTLDIDPMSGGILIILTLIICATVSDCTKHKAAEDKPVAQSRPIPSDVSKELK